jgi:large subunit ribosomal protein L7/L12
MANNKITRAHRLKEKITKLRADLQIIEARQNKSERKKNTRRKILIGAYWLEQVQQNRTNMEDIEKWMDGFLIRDYDRVLFELPALPKKEV